MIQQKALKFILFFFICYSFVKAIAYNHFTLDENGEYTFNDYTTKNGFRAYTETIGKYSYLKITIERKESEKVTYFLYCSKSESSTEKTLLMKSSDEKIIKYIDKDQTENGFYMSIENDPKEAHFRIIFKGTNEKGNDESKSENENGKENENGNNDKKEDSNDSKALKIVLIIVAVIIVVIIIIGVIYYLKIYKPNKNLNDDVNKISLQDEFEAKGKENEMKMI